jgi:hypothetical protein
MFKHKRISAVVVLGFVLFASLLGAGVSAQNVTQGYQASGDLQNGMVVRLKSGTAGTVEALDQKYETDMFGLVVASADAAVSLSSPNQSQVYVATFGQYAALVNTQNGPIKTGDQLVISSIKGTAMKADTKHQVLIGKAMQNFSDNSNAEGHIKLSSGDTVAVGRIMVDIGVTRNPTYSGDVAAGVPHILISIAHAITNKPVTALRLYGCLVIMFISLAVAGGILYAGVRTGMTSIGRNPLAKKSILRQLITITLMALIVVFIGIIAVYLLLRI